MADRIPMRFYRLINNSVSNSNISNANPLIKTSFSYLQGVTVNDVQYYGTNAGTSPNVTDTSAVGTINITPDNVPANLSSDYNKPFTVKQENSLLYVLIAQRKFYLKDVNPLSNVTNDIVPVFEFYLNPQHVTPVYRKLKTPIRTRGGWEIQHWGEDLTEVRVNGRTGAMQRDITKVANPGNRTSVDGAIFAQTLATNQSITKSTAWQRLNALKALYHADHSQRLSSNLYKLGFNFYDTFYIGYFLEFTGPEADAEFPFIMNFSFTVKVETEQSVPDVGTTDVASVNTYDNINSNNSGNLV